MLDHTTPSTQMPQNDRRSFLAKLGSMSAVALVSPSAAWAGPQAELTRSNASWDFSWLEQLKGKHKQVFDFGGVEASADDPAGGVSPLRVPRNYLNAHKEVSGLDYPEINTIVGIATKAFPINASDEIWLKYGLGEKWKVKDSKTGTWAVRNVFADASMPTGERGVTVQALKQRGTIFWQCNNALNGIVAILAPAMKMEAPAVREELIAGFLPGVKLVPAHTMVVGLAQERGFTYEKV
jgi:hypothetical protein